jgi:hypothetical protein
VHHRGHQAEDDAEQVRDEQTGPEEQPGVNAKNHDDEDAEGHAIVASAEPGAFARAAAAWEASRPQVSPVWTLVPEMLGPCAASGWVNQAYGSA